MAFLRHLDTRDIYDIWDICKMSTTCFCDIIYWDDIYREINENAWCIYIWDLQILVLLFDWRTVIALHTANSVFP